MLILLHIEGVIVVPAESHGEHEPLEAVIVGALVGARAHSRVAVRQKFVVIRLEDGPRLVSTLLEHNNHEATHQEGGVCLLCIVK